VKSADIINKFKSRSGKITLLLTGILFLIVLVFEFSGMRDEFYPGEDKIQKELRGLKQAQINLQKELNEAAELKFRRESFIAQGKDYWMPVRDGKTETEVQKIISQAAKIAGLKLSSLGDIRPIKITDEIFAMEIAVTSADSMENTARFFAELYRVNTKVYWQRCQLRPDNAKDSRNVSLNGNIKFLCVNDQKAADFISGTKK
jgi:hypothetical protein